MVSLELAQTHMSSLYSPLVPHFCSFACLQVSSHLLLFFFPRPCHSGLISHHPLLLFCSFLIPHLWSPASPSHHSEGPLSNQTSDLVFFGGFFIELVRRCNRLFVCRALAVHGVATLLLLLSHVCPLLSSVACPGSRARAPGSPA